MFISTAIVTPAFSIETQQLLGHPHSTGANLERAAKKSVKLQKPFAVYGLLAAHPGVRIVRAMTLPQSFPALPDVLHLGGAEALPAPLRGGVAALGNFDGVHKGHQAVIRAAGQRARAAGVPWLVLTFDPHPSRFFRPDSAPFLLTPVAQKAEAIRALGVDAVLVLNFADVSPLAPEAFVAEVLARQLGLRGVVTGDDFTFGRARMGNAVVLADLGARYGVSSGVVPPVCGDDGQIISSTRVRACLETGAPEQAALMLGRWWSIRSQVEPGDQRGHKLAFPTANLTLQDVLRPRYGVYAVRVRLADGRRLDGVANIGLRPTIQPPRELLEAHLFDFSGDLYNQTITVELVAFIRPERRFAGLAELQVQIAADAQEARAMLAQPSHAADRFPANTSQD